jgi:hypothetical protein
MGRSRSVALTFRIGLCGLTAASASGACASAQMRPAAIAGECRWTPKVPLHTAEGRRVLVAAPEIVPVGRDSLLMFAYRVLVVQDDSGPGSAEWASDSLDWIGALVTLDGEARLIPNPVPGHGVQAPRSYAVPGGAGLVWGVTREPEPALPPAVVHGRYIGGAWGPIDTVLEEVGIEWTPVSPSRVVRAASGRPVVAVPVVNERGTRIERLDLEVPDSSVQVWLRTLAFYVTLSGDGAAMSFVGGGNALYAGPVAGPVGMRDSTFAVLAGGQGRPVYDAVTIDAANGQTWLVWRQTFGRQGDSIQAALLDRRGRSVWMSPRAFVPGGARRIQGVPLQDGGEAGFLLTFETMTDGMLGALQWRNSRWTPVPVDTRVDSWHTAATAFGRWVLVWPEVMAVRSQTVGVSYLAWCEP